MIVNGRTNMFFIDFFKTYKEEKKIYERNMLLKAFKDGTITSIMMMMAILIFLTSILSITFLINLTIYNRVVDHYL